MSEAASDPKVRAVFDAYPPAMREALDYVRLLILESARAAGVELIETLKWGQPAYLPARPRVGTTVRIDAVKGSPELYAVYVNCKTTLLDSYRLLYPDAFAFEVQRALIFSTAEPPPEEALRHCLALALTYHRKR
ncbi:MAG: DUF1801 domain-containing protein [Alphaproteobacteria bacterium]|nr:DUF1801 domain-containing protein [Alphaproteobacteria bacterium]MBU1513000.1 DUF1801 domain-containing protein [Alphaproteobacteria bacterium]MBU2095108.1 DUF1801 domain-containing protein [Alphaproteobacteria bacterium]MBU2153041.1 DUF1801 domain-containing protein [Alphaproteobacteria bacterium]MBU2306359.1 DUF1801 domain-containing protein [Alphaproteobacteria bacterium]